MADLAFVSLRSAGRAAALEGTNQEFETLYASTFPRVYGFVRWRVPNAQVAQDLVSHVFLKAYRAHRTTPPKRDPEVWLFSIAHNAVIDYWRTEGRRLPCTVSIDECALPRDRAQDPEAVILLRERNARLLQAVSGLEPDSRAILALKFAAQRKNREIARILDISEGAVSMRLLRALRQLREHFSEVD